MGIDGVNNLKPDGGAEPEHSTLWYHAKRELELLGESDEWFKDNILKIVDIFGNAGHSGGSAMISIHYITKLLQHKNLSPLTSNPEEWVDRSKESGGLPMWQNSRNSEAFSEDGGKTYYLLSENQHTDGKLIHKTKRA